MSLPINPAAATIESIVHPPSPNLRTEVARLFYEEMEHRLLWPLLPKDADRAISLLVEGLSWDGVYAAIDGDGRVLATAFVTNQERPLCVDPAVFRREWGLVRWALRIGMVDVMRIGTQGRSSLRMEGLAVRSDLRWRGLGAQLMERVIADARARGYSSLHLDVLDENRVARHLAESLGFAVKRTIWAPCGRQAALRTFSAMRLDL